MVPWGGGEGGGKGVWGGGGWWGGGSGVGGGVLLGVGFVGHPTLYGELEGTYSCVYCWGNLLSHRQLISIQKSLLKYLRKLLGSVVELQPVGLRYGV